MKKALYVIALLVLILVSVRPESTWAQGILPKPFPVTIRLADQMIENHIKIYRVYDPEVGAIMYVFRGYETFGVTLVQPKDREHLMLPLVASGEGE